MVKKKKKTQYKNYNIFLIVIIIILSITNIILLYHHNKDLKEEPIVEEVLFKATEDKFNPKNKYYATIQYSKFKTLYRGKNVSTIAIIDNSSNTYNKFKEMINKTAYYKNTKIYLLELSKLSRKNEIAFYNLDQRLAKLETNYIITVSKNKILSITTFDNSELSKIIEGLGE